MGKKIIFSLLLLLLFAKSLSAGLNTDIYITATDIYVPANTFVNAKGFNSGMGPNTATPIVGTGTLVPIKDFRYYFAPVIIVPNATATVNFVYTIIERKIIEWRTTSKTIPISGGSIAHLGFNPVRLNQVGTKYLVTFAQIEWKGETKEMELGRVLIKSDTVLERQISESPLSTTLDN